MALSLHHHADQGLCAGFPHQNAAGIAQGVGNGLHSCLDIGVILRRLLVRHADIYQHLGIDLEIGHQLAQLGLLGHHDFHDLEAGEDAVAGGGVLGEDDVAGLLAANAAVILHHIFVDVFVAHFGLGIANAKLVKGLIEAKIGHHGGHHGVGQELAALLHVLGIEVENMVAGNDVPVFIHGHAAVGVAVIGKAHVHAVFLYVLLKSLNVGGACIEVDVQAIWLCVNDVSLGAQCVKDSLGQIPRAAVGAVQRDLHALKGINPQRNEVAQVTVSAGYIVHRAADVIAMGEGECCPLLIKKGEVSVEICLHQGDGLLIHLLAHTVDELDAVIIIGVVAGGDHNAAVKAIHPCHIGNRGCCSHVEQVGISAGSHQSAHQRILKHVAGTTGVLADNNAGRFIYAAAALAFGIIPTEKSTDGIGVIRGQPHIGLPTEAVGSKVFCHKQNSSDVK